MESKLYPSPESGAPLLVLLTHEEEGERVLAAVRGRTREPFSLLCVGVEHWGDDLTPWPSESIHRGSPPYAGGADAFLEKLVGEVVPAAERELGSESAYRALVGYSLAGLFALWTAYRTEAFSRIGSVSGSLWYEGFADYALRETPAGSPGKIYFSLGERESRTRHPLVRTVEENTILIERFWAERGCRTVFERNRGGHFYESEERTARAAAWLLENG